MAEQLIGHAGSDFLGVNPAGRWSYGYGETGVSFVRYDQFDANGHQSGPYSFFPTGFSGWSLSGVQPSSDQWNAMVAKNNTNTDYYWAAANSFIPQSVLYVHPGERTDSIVRYTVDTGGDYRFVGDFSILSGSPSGIQAKIFLNGDDVGSVAFIGGSGSISGPGATPTTVGGSAQFSWTVNLTAGDVVSFGVAPDGWFGNDSTGFAANVYLDIPEPTSAIGIVVGLAGAVLSRRWKACRQRT